VTPADALYLDQETAMVATHTPPAGISDFDGGHNPPALYSAWDQWISQQMATTPDFPAWYESTHPPVAGTPATASPPWQGLPRTALILNGNDVRAAAKAVENAVAFGTGVDALLVNQPPFLNAAGQPVSGFKYRPMDEYLEWVTKTDADGVVRELWFTCEGPEYWQLIATQDPDLLVALYAQILGVPDTSVDKTRLFFSETLTHVEPFARNQKLTFKKGDYNPYNEYNISGAVHLTQGANTLGAEIGLAMAGSLIYGNPPKTTDPALICCAQYGEPNRFSDPTIGKEVNDLARAGKFVTLRDPVGLYIASINGANFTDWNGNSIPNLSSYLTPIRKSADGSLILRAVFKVPDGVMKNGKQARVGDLNYLGQPITTGGQVAHAVTMHLFGQALPGAPQQTPQSCLGHPCTDPAHPGFIVLTDINTPCGSVTNHSLHALLASVQPKLPAKMPGHLRHLATRRSRKAVQ
jgi:hypothetical protein